MAEFSVVLVEPQYEGNIGSVARLMKNFGFKELILVNPPELSKDARKMAVHAKDILDNAIKASDFKKLCEGFDYVVGTTAVIATDSNALRTPVFPEDLANALETKGKIALVFGREADGLLNDEIALCDLIVTIPSSNEYPTLNLSHSVAIILYELSRLEMRKKFNKLRKLRKLEKIEKDVLLKNYDSLVECIFLNDYERRIVKKTFRQILGRAFVSGREANTLTGLYRKSGNKIRKAGLCATPRLPKDDTRSNKMSDP